MREAKRSQKFYSDNQNNVQEAMKAEQFQHHLRLKTKNKMIHAAPDKSFTMFHGLLAGTVDVSNGIIRIQKFSRGFLVFQQREKKGKDYEIFESDQKFASYNDEGNMLQDFTIVGFTAHDVKSYIVHMWSETSKSWYRARGSNMLKFLQSTQSNFRRADLVVFPPSSIDTTDVVNYFRSFEKVLTTESDFFKSSNFRAKKSLREKVSPNSKSLNRRSCSRR
jgi:hypothetical protein